MKRRTTPGYPVRYAASRDIDVLFVSDKPLRRGGHEWAYYALPLRNQKYAHIIDGIYGAIQYHEGCKKLDAWVDFYVPNSARNQVLERKMFLPYAPNGPEEFDGALQWLVETIEIMKILLTETVPNWEKLKTTL